MALFDHVILPKHGIITIEDATGILATVAYEEGNFQHSELQPGYMNAEKFKDRGMDFVIAETDEQDVDISFDCYATDFYDATEKTLPDAVMGTGAFSGGTSVFGAGRPWGVKVTFTATQTPYGAGANSTIVFAKVRPSYAFAEGKPGRFSFKGMVFSPTTTVTRS